jgi:hypothetical protein
MAIETLRPNGAGSETNIPGAVPDTGEAHWEDVDEAVADDGTTYVVNNTTDYLRDLYALPAYSGSGTINKITVYCRARCNGTDPAYYAYMKISCRSDATTTDGEELTLHPDDDPGYWKTWSKEWALNPADSQPWEWADIDALEIGANTKKGDQSLKLTQLYVEVDYTLDTEKSSSDTGTGSEGTPLAAATLAGSESGQGQGAISSQMVALISADTGAAIELGALLKELFVSELGQGSDSFITKIEAPSKGGGMKLWI